MIEILSDVCKGCLLCIPACPHESICNTKAKLNKRGLYSAEYLDPDGKSTGCRLCAVVCPDVAIYVYKEPKRKSA